MIAVSVVTIKAGVLFKNKLFTGKNALVKAEKCFKKYVTNIIGAKVLKDIMNMALDEGYYEGPECSVCISEPEVIK